MNSIISVSLLASLFLCFSFRAQAQDLVESNSKKYENFNDESKERKDFALSQNGRVNARLKASASQKKIEDFLIKKYEAETTMASRRLPGGQLKLVDRGLSKAQELVMDTIRGSEVLFSTFQVARNNRYRIARMMLNPNKSKVLLTLRLDGSRDNTFFNVIDLNSKSTLLSQFFCRCNPSHFYWKSENEILFQDKDADGKATIKNITFNSEGMSISEVYGDYMFVMASEKVMILAHKNLDTSLILSSDQEPLEVSYPSDFEFEDLRTDFIFFSQVKEENGISTTTFHRINRKTSEITEVKSFYGNISSTHYIVSTGIVFVEGAGYRSTLNYYDYASDSVISLKIPEFVSLTSAYEADTEGELVLSFASDLVDDKELKWNIKTNTINFGDEFKREMLESDELSLDVVFKMIESFDGTKIPVKIISKKGSSLLKAPVYIEVYGGFGVPGSLAPEKNPEVLEFIKRGGVYVAPGLRGGNEFGETWHTSAMKEKKIKTYEDLAATAKYLIDNNISEKSKIAIAGTSNGGLTVAATGLLFPQYFGLVISTNGVLDLLAKETLDARFRGWRGEYGDARVPEEAAYLAKISPVELVAQAENGPAFLVINGRKDTRVNPAHSIKFAKAAEDLRATGKNINVEMLALNNSGHPVSSVENDYIAIRSLVVIWSRIYDDFGMTY